MTQTDYTEALAALGFSLKVTAGPSPGVDKDGEKEWPHIAYTVELSLNGKPILTEAYKLGVGHAKVPKRWEDQPPRLTSDEICAFNTLRNNPHAQLKDKALHASFAAKLAKHQKVVPQLADALHSFLMDGSAYYNAESFEDWAANFGYSPDSRKAEAMYRQCDAIGRKLANGVPSAVLEQAREILADY